MAGNDTFGLAGRIVWPGLCRDGSGSPGDATEDYGDAAMRFQHPPPRELLEALGREALAAVEPTRLTARTVRRLRGEVDLLAVGKAAPAMTRGVIETAGVTLRRALVITKGAVDERAPWASGIELMTAGHPLPDAASFVAGAAAQRFVAPGRGAPPLLVLISGGASALMEAPAAGITRRELCEAHAWLLGSGLPIATVNRIRARLSALKGGGLGACLAGRTAQVLLLSDVAGDHPWAVGSGPFCAPPRGPLPAARALPPWLDALLRRARPPRRGRAVPHRVIGSSAMAARAALAAARSRGMPARAGRGGLRGDAARAGRRLARALQEGPPGVTVWHGETTVRLPADHGSGGRCRHLALAAAVELAGQRGHALLALATDGEDHVGGAGALIDDMTLARGSAAGLDAARALARSDSGGYLAATGDALPVARTGGNVRDLVIGWRSPS